MLLFRNVNEKWKERTGKGRIQGSGWISTFNVLNWQVESCRKNVTVIH